MKNITREQWVEAARNIYSPIGGIECCGLEFDRDSKVSIDDSGAPILGAYVQAWVWVPISEAKKKRPRLAKEG